VLQGPGTNREFNRLMSERIHFGQGFSVELLNYHKSGRPYWIFIGAQPLYDEQGRLTHFMAIESDIMNLLLNAAQAMDSRGKVRITTALEGQEVVVHIADTGQGMTPEVLSKLFTPFFTTKPPGKGTGLGLSISYSIISRHKGRIEVQSEPGQGSTFTLYLPAAPE
jgi:signal transduction histidine kinase